MRAGALHRLGRVGGQADHAVDVEREQHVRATARRHQRVALRGGPRGAVVQRLGDIEQCRRLRRVRRDDVGAGGTPAHRVAAVDDQQRDLVAQRGEPLADLVGHRSEAVVRDEHGVRPAHPTGRRQGLGERVDQGRPGGPTRRRHGGDVVARHVLPTGDQPPLHRRRAAQLDDARVGADTGVGQEPAQDARLAVVAEHREQVDRRAERGEVRRGVRGAATGTVAVDELDDRDRPVPTEPARGPGEPAVEQRVAEHEHAGGTVGDPARQPGGDGRNDRRGHAIHGVGTCGHRSS